jgi:hypothetical protein
VIITATASAEECHRAQRHRERVRAVTSPAVWIDHGIVEPIVIVWATWDESEYLEMQVRMTPNSWPRVTAETDLLSLFHDLTGHY